MKYTGGTGSAVGRVIEDAGTGFDASNTSRFNLGPVSVRGTTGIEYFHDALSSENGGVNPGTATAPCSASSPSTASATASSS